MTGDASSVGVFQTGLYGTPHSGDSFAHLGQTPTTGTSQATMSQMFQTTAGLTHCTLSFYAAIPAGLTAAQSSKYTFSFKALVGTIVVADASAAGTGYTKYTGAFIGTGVQQTLQFQFTNVPSYYQLDDVSITCTS